MLQDAEEWHRGQTLGVLREDFMKKVIAEVNTVSNY